MFILLVIFSFVCYLLGVICKEVALGATSIEKIPKISASGRDFLDPLPPSSKRGPTDENIGISYLIVILKFGFFETSVPSPPISSESRTSPILSIEVAPKLLNRCHSYKCEVSLESYT